MQPSGGTLPASADLQSSPLCARTYQLQPDTRPANDFLQPQAGLQAGFVNRDGVHYPPYFDRPAAEAADLLLLVNECILAMPTE